LRLGVKGLDDVIRDFPDSGLVIIAGGPGIGKSVLAGQFIYRGVVDYGERGVYVSFSETKAAFYASMASLGMDFEKLEREGLFHFLNFFISRKEDFSLSLDSLLESISKFNARRVVCDSISVISPLLSEFETRKLIQVLKALVVNMNALCVLVCETSSEAKSDELGSLGFVSDVIILLRWREEGAWRVKELEVLKVRGVPVEKGIYEFDIDRKHGGLWVISPPKPALRGGRWERVATGVEWLDDALQGGLYRGSLTMVKGESGTGKTCLCIHIAANSASRGEKCVYVSTEESEDEVYHLLEEFGFNLESIKGGMRVIRLMPDESSPSRLYSFFDCLVDEEKPSILVIDSLTPFKYAMSHERFYKFLRYMQSLVKANRFVLVATSTLSLIEETVETDIIGLFDNLFILRHALTDGAPHKTLFIVKARSSDHQKTPLRFEVTTQGIRTVGERAPMTAT